MTVDDKSFQHFAASNQAKARDWVNQVKEVTGCSDDDEIKRAFEQSRDSNGEFSLNGAIEHVLGHRQTDTATGPEAASQPLISQQLPSPQKTKVVDLTEDNKTEDDLQRAIALSLQDGGMVGQSTAATSTSMSGISQEEQDVSKALEASLLESSQVRRKKDSQNPYDRQRDGQWPVGLKNVGQTCWFSAVIQSLFHIPAFRMLVLNYNPPCLDTAQVEKRKILEFMAELRKLFSLLLNSQRKYVDPSKAVGILRGSLGGGGDAAQGCSNQQDVSEFTHKLLDWLEEAFNVKSVETKSTNCDIVKSDSMEEGEPMDSESEKMDKEKESEEKPTGSSSSGNVNQMNSLFYGQVEIEGRNQGIEFSRGEQFGQWPLQVNGFKHIHDSLEASMAYQVIDSDQNCVLSGQERWFTTLPPVLFLELSRFQFNTSKGIAEKVNNVLEFPQEIFLDRYLQSNKELVRRKREEVRRLMEKKENLSKQLDCYLKYGDFSHPLVNVLRSALQFARSGGEDRSAEAEAGQAELEVTMQVDSPRSQSPALTTNLGSESQSSPVTSTQIPIIREDQSTHAQSMDEKETGSPVTAMEVEASDTETSHLTQASIKPPKPRFVSDMEMKVLSSCLGRWISEVDEEIVALTQDLRSIEASISIMYDEDSLKMRGYRLHAVMVHEGDANQGHYWAYVNHVERGWLKFNDNTVSQSTWEEIIKEAVGGRTSTSAYSCVYVDVARNNLFSETSSLLPTDLDIYTMEDNKNFAAEIVKWDEEQQKLKEEEAASASGPQPVLIGDDPECQIIEQKPDLSQSHALLSRDTTLEYLNLVANEKKKPEVGPPKNNTNTVINKIYSSVKSKVNNCRPEGFGESYDIRLESFLHYCVANELTVDHYKKAVLEQVALQEYELVSDLGREVSRTARDSLRHIPPSIEQEVVLWHRVYHQFRIVVNYFVLGVEKYTENFVEDALELLTISYVVNEKIIEDPPISNCKAMAKRGLVKHFHLAVEAVNAKLVEEFEAGSDPASVARRVGDTLVPAIHILQARTNKSPGGRDAGLLEEVRGRWCAMIEQPLPDRKRDYWGTIFNTVVPDDNAVVMKSPANLRYPKYSDDQKLGQRYRSAMQRIMRERESEK